MRDGWFASPVCNGVQCHLCPYNCFLPEGARGRCRVRSNYGGRIKTLVYSKPVSVHLDPIEKKPVYHLYPGSLVYSLATPGCNLKCKACQNWEISQIWPEEAARRAVVPAALAMKADASGRVYGELKQKEVSAFSPSDIVACALATHSKAIAYTYSEPVIFYEYMYDTAALARRAGLKNVMVSAGYINRGPLLKLLKYMDVVKIDLKGFSPEFYRDYAGGRLEPVKETLLTLKKSGVLFEVVNLAVPGLNDDGKSMADMIAWIKTNLGADTPLFFSRFMPNYQLDNLPPTPVETLTRARAEALKAGMKYVYIGNVPGSEGENTYCPKCGRALVRRYGYAVLENLLSSNGGRCPYDGTKIPGIW
ncbi:MAG: AmmeMemoRadiSam system radical SAM enzyme [Elusimicrobia bacterium GWC2_51_8]|nr:MAG: AmmeMemoRadiSam system radical SAM enzyme [Elusimicrobia bacterium GWA2_51_34]OGR57567.1 MAG: AmmeMemoRadiSam system radical SAM enzyme [Elusimicrobia bacterium GWC2_51_8]OGR84557.1 MAG: AmmeMemoRadiSam system radical SAM enzyme [Elusimicrobia bacterium GWF2_52_66]